MHDPAVSEGGLRDVVYRRAFLLWEQAGGVQLPASRLSRRAARWSSARLIRGRLVIAACESCNGEKGDRTPVEWGRKLLWMPGPPTERDADQERVWLALSQAA